jgi:hypothetical protein
MALVGLAFSGEGGAGTCEIPQGPGGFVFTQLMEHGFTRQIQLMPNRILFFQVEHRKGYPDGKVRLDIVNAQNRYETIWIEEGRQQLLRCFSGSFVQLHQPVSDETGGEPHELEDPTFEVRSMWVNPDYVPYIGPSSIVSFSRRRLGKIHLANGTAYELHESLETVESIFRNYLEQGRTTRISDTFVPTKPR